VYIVSFKTLTVVLLKIQVCWNVAVFGWVGGSQCCTGI